MAEPSFCLNRQSMILGTVTTEQADAMLSEILYALLPIYRRWKKLYLYLDEPAAGKKAETEYSFKEYFGGLLKKKRDYHDFAQFISQIIKRTPYYDFVNGVPEGKLLTGPVKFFGQVYDYADILIYAYYKHFYVISIPTIPVWKNNELHFVIGCEPDCVVKNIFDKTIKAIYAELLPFSLDDGERFTFIGKEYDGQKMYREKETNYIWYKDGLHKNHYEIFDSTSGKHIGEATLQGIIDYSKKDSSKTIKQCL
jgi:hypothetical protein